VFGDGLGTADLFGCVTCSVVEYVIGMLISVTKHAQT
jgi:hypothetical protein